jgi:hypothetical protein
LLAAGLLPLLRADDALMAVDDKAGGVPRGDLLGFLRAGKLTECTSIGPWTGTSHQLQLNLFEGKNNSVACGVSFSVDPTKGNFLVILMMPPAGSALYGPIVTDGGVTLFPSAGTKGVQFTPSSDSLKKLKNLDSAFEKDALIFAIPLTPSVNAFKIGIFFQGVLNAMRNPGVLAAAFYVTTPGSTAASQINIDDALDHFAMEFGADSGGGSQDDSADRSPAVDVSSTIDRFRKFKDEHDQGRISDTNFSRKWNQALREVFSVASTTKEASAIDEDLAANRFQTLKDLHDQKLTSDDEYNTQRGDLIRRCFLERSLPEDLSLDDKDFAAQQLAKLKELHDKNLIDDDEYNIKRGEFLGL